MTFAIIRLRKQLKKQKLDHFILYDGDLANGFYYSFYLLFYYRYNVSIDLSVLTLYLNYIEKEISARTLSLSQYLASQVK